MTNQVKQGMTKTEFKVVVTAKNLVHAFFQAMRQGVTRAQAELWANEACGGNVRVMQVIKNA